MNSVLSEVAASAATFTPEEAERQLDAATTPEEAWRIYEYAADRAESWRVIKLKAERRYGELLGKAEHGGDRKSDQVTGRDLKPDQKMARTRARKVAAVPQEKFDAYITENGAKSSREGLLRKNDGDKPKAAEQRDYNNKHWENDDVIAWVARRMRAGKTRDEIVAESEAGKDGWPLPGCWLGKNAADICRAIAADRKRRGDSNRARQPKESGKRLRQLHAEKRAGRTTNLWYMQKAMAELVGALEGFDLPELDWSEETEELVDELYADLERGARWTDIALDVVVAHMGELGRQRKISACTELMNNPGATPSERMTAARMAEKLKRKRRAIHA